MASQEKNEPRTNGWGKIRVNGLNRKDWVKLE